MNNFVVENENIGARLDVFLQEKMPHFTRSHIKNMIEKGEVTVNEKIVKAGEKLKLGRVVCVLNSQVTEMQVLPENIDIDIVYEDEYFVVVNKQQGLVVHPANGNESGTLVNALLYHVKDLSGINGVIRPGIVHRIDKDTSGLLVVAKNDFAHVSLSKQIEEKSCKRKYKALLFGNLKQDSGRVEFEIGRCEKDRKKMAVVAIGKGKKAITHYNVLERYIGYTFCEFELETGRTHQIRVAAKHIGHSIVGDSVYGNKKCEFKLDGQLLHAYSLTLTHPKTKKVMTFNADVPEYFLNILNKLRAKVLQN